MKVSFSTVIKNHILNNKNSEEGYPSSFKRTHSLEKTPERDVVSFSGAAKTKGIENTQTLDKSNETKKTAARKLSSTQDKFEFVKESKILTNEVLYYLEPVSDNKSVKSFTPVQTEIIDAAVKKIKFFKKLSVELACDAEAYGDNVLNHMKEVFGSDEGLGQYMVLRKKDTKSIYDKLAKEFKNNYIKNGVHDIFSLKLFDVPYSMLDDNSKDIVKLYVQEGEIPIDKKDYVAILNAFKPDVKGYLAKRQFKKNFEDLSRTEKAEIKQLMARKQNSSANIEKEEAVNWVRDLVGIRLILPEGNRVNMGKVERYLDKALKKNKLHLTRISNYRSNSVLPYLNQDTARRWKDTIPGVELVTSSVKKVNGYTTTQMNFEHYIPSKDRPVLVEFQIRSKEMNYINDVEHYIYDVLENKDITKGIPELKVFFESSGFIKAVREVFGKQKYPKNTIEANLPSKEEKYMDYEHAMFAYIRDSETPTYKFGKMYKPILADFDLGEYESVLSFDALNAMNEKAQIIKERFGTKKKNKK